MTDSGLEFSLGLQIRPDDRTVSQEAALQTGRTQAIQTDFMTL